MSQLVARTTAVRHHNPRRIAAAALLASSIEWYDFQVYGTAAALILSHAFFPSVSPVAGVLASFGTFGVGFVARPFGGAIFGHFGDRLGRKRVLIAALLLMAVATTLIGLLPGYGTIGVAAPILLILLRILQGIAVGGQWGGAMLLATEHAPQNRRGLYGSISQMGVPVGLITGTGIYLILNAILTKDQFNSWGWRIPFLLSIAMFGVALYIHRYIAVSADIGDTAEAHGKPTQSPLAVTIRDHGWSVLLAGLAALAPQAMFYIGATGMTDYGTRELGLSGNTMLTAVLVSMVGLGVVLPLSALLSDVIGRKKVFATGLVLMAAWAFAVFPLVRTKQPGLVVLALLVAQLTIGILLGSLPALFSQMFPREVRYSGASLGYQIAAILGGGLAPFIMVAILDKTGRPFNVALYVLIATLVALAALGLIRLRDDPDAAA